MIDPVDHRLPARRQPRDHQTDRGPQVRRHYLRTGEKLDTPDSRRVTLHRDVCTKAAQFRHMHEAVLEYGLAHNALAIRQRH